MRTLSWISRGVSFLLLAAPAMCADWYVDAAAGNNANSGLAPNQAWKTITHALQSTRTGLPERIHIAPGVYDATLGEVFPFDLFEGQGLIGAGPALSHVISNGAFAVSIAHYPALPYAEVTANTFVEGLSIYAGQQPILISSSWGPCTPELRNLDVSGGSLQGIFVYGSAPVSPEPVLRHVVSQGNAVGLGLAKGTVLAEDCVFSGNSSAGIEMRCSAGWARVTLDRCRIESNFGHGLFARAFLSSSTAGNVAITARECSISGNGEDGVRVSRVSAGQIANLSLVGCTIADNSGVGISTIDAGADPITLSESIVFSNFDDLQLVGSAVVSNCDIGDGDFSGVNGNFSADPLFVNAAASDWRLKFLSPCIDVAGLPGSPSLVDLSGYPRTTDGDLDTFEARDVGAFEFAPLFLRSQPQIGTQLTFECWGPAGATTTMYFSRRELASTPQTTPFGEFDLDPVQFGVFRIAIAGAVTPGLVQRNIPNSPALVGSTFTFQALTNSPLSPTGAAYTNAIQLTIMP